MKHIIQAHVYDAVRHEMAGSIMAEKADPSHLSPDRHHFYCSDCLKGQDHFTRLKRVKEQEAYDAGVQITLPPRFVLYRKDHSTHQCDHRLRFQEIDDLAERYRAKPHGNHSYSFLMNMSACINPVILDGVEESVHSAARLRKILYASMYDPDLLARQKLYLGGQYESLQKVVYDQEKREELVRQSIIKSWQQKEFYAAVIFKPMARRDYWHRLTDEFGIPAQPSGQIDVKGIAMTPNVVLRFKSEFARATVKDMVSRDGGNNSAAVLAFGRVVTDPSYVDGKIKEAMRAGKGERSPILQTVLWINTVSDVTEWNYPTSFESMIEQQEGAPPISKQRALAL